LAFVFGFIGLFTNPMLLFIALFVWIGAIQEAGAAQVRSALFGTPTRAAMLTDFETLQSSDTLADAVRLILSSSQRDFPVFEQGRVAGILTGTDMLLALAGFGQDHPVGLAMRRDFPVAKPAEMLETVFQRLQECDCETILVVHNAQLIGLVTSDKLRQYLLIESTLQKRGAGSALLYRTLGRDMMSPDQMGKGRVSQGALRESNSV
jgi:CBS domain-containing protein